MSFPFSPSYFQQRSFIARPADPSPANNFNKLQLQLSLSEGFQKLIPLPDGLWLVYCRDESGFFFSFAYHFTDIIFLFLEFPFCCRLLINWPSLMVLFSVTPIYYTIPFYCKVNLRFLIFPNLPIKNIQVLFFWIGRN